MKRKRKRKKENENETNALEKFSLILWGKADKHHFSRRKQYYFFLRQTFKTLFAKNDCHNSEPSKDCMGKEKVENGNNSELILLSYIKFYFCYIILYCICCFCFKLALFNYTIYFISCAVVCSFLYYMTFVHII